MFWSLALGALAALGLPQIGLIDLDARGCGAPALMSENGVRRLEGAAPGLCIRAAFAARLEADEVNVVLRVEKTDEAEAPRDRLFVYRLVGARLSPRFLGSGSPSFTVVSIERVPGLPTDALAVTVSASNGARRTLRCELRQFPLVCADEPPAVEH